MAPARTTDDFVNHAREFAERDAEHFRERYGVGVDEAKLRAVYEADDGVAVMPVPKRFAEAVAKLIRDAVHDAPDPYIQAWAEAYQ